MTHVVSLIYPPRLGPWDIQSAHQLFQSSSDVSMATLWLFNIAMGNGPFIDGLPIKNGGSFHGYVK